MELEVLRELLNGLLTDVTARPGMLAPGMAGAFDGCGLPGCEGWTSLSHVCRTLSPSNCPNSGLTC